MKKMTKFSNSKTVRTFFLLIILLLTFSKDYPQFDSSEQTMEKDLIQTYKENNSNKKKMLFSSIKNQKKVTPSSISFDRIMKRSYILIFSDKIRFKIFNQKFADYIQQTFSQLNCLLTKEVSFYEIKKLIDPQFKINYCKPYNDETVLFPSENTNSKKVFEEDKNTILLPQKVLAKSKREESILAEEIFATSLWNQGIKGNNTKIAILDTGINFDHPAFYEKIIASKSFVLKEYGYQNEEPSVVDYEGHGSHVAGIASGYDLDNPAYWGIAPEASLIIGKVAGTEGIATITGLIAAYNWALEQEADVINLSFGGADFPGNNPLDVLLNTIVVNDTLLTISAGNYGNNGEYSISFPGSTLAAITVGACHDEYIAYFSSIGPTVEQERKPDLVAPGVDITAPGANGANYAVK
ncbi:hypothetical protein EU523_00620, partial [Candidatus Heimdallarchaeota archaeon]